MGQEILDSGIRVNKNNEKKLCLVFGKVDLGFFGF